MVATQRVNPLSLVGAANRPNGAAVDCLQTM